MRKIIENVFSVGVIDWDRRLFDELIPLPDGTSYNSFLIKGSDKTALLDTVDPTKEDELLENIKDEQIDYIISHHAEQDHSGTIPNVLKIHPKALVVTNQKCKEMLIDLLLIPEEKFLIIKDGETLSLGNKTLKFIFTPWVHWPETFVSYLIEDKILFTCDFFGSHFATSDLFAIDKAKTYIAAKRYYAEIMMPFRVVIRKNIEKISSMDITIIAPSHGPIYNEPKYILDNYNKWISDETENKVVVVYVSMHGSTKTILDCLTKTLMEKQISVKYYNLIKTDIGELAIDLVDCTTIIIGSPIVHSGPHPAVIYGAALVNALRPKLKYASIVGSFGWGSRLVETIVPLIPNLKAEIIEPVITKGHPKENDLKKIRELAEKIFQKHKILFGL